MKKSIASAIRQLGKLYGVQTAYEDIFHQRQYVSAEILIDVLTGLGVPLDAGNAIDLLHQECNRRRQRFIQPVTVVWDGEFSQLLIHLNEQQSEKKLKGYLTYEDQSQQTLKLNLGVILDQHSLGGDRYLVKQFNLAQKLPRGYHRLSIEIEDQVFDSLIISAPRWAYSQPYSAQKRPWGLFAPLYALHSAHSFGAGDFTDLNQIIHWMADQGGQLLGALPLFAGFLQQPCEPSPYSPVSRLFFNEFYLDVTQAPEFKSSQTAQQLFASPEFQAQLNQVRRQPLINYEKIMGLKRQILEILSAEFFRETTAQRQREFQQFLAENPLAEDYAQFRARREQTGQSGQNYYLYVQWQTRQQLAKAANSARQRKVDLYLDMPLGVHPDGFDVWRYSDLFAPDLAVGSPPDTVFTAGQNWEFPPLIPHKLRESGYQYFIQSLRQVMPYVSLLRLDHVMGLHRLYCIPKDHLANQGAFIRYSAEELYAILCLESHRCQTSLVGENLGTVPKYVNTALAQHRFYTMNVLQYELKPEHADVFSHITPHTVTSLNTHDMFPFAAFVQGMDINPGQYAAQEWRRREPLNPQHHTRLSKIELKKQLSNCLMKLARSSSQFMLINLEDIWLETNPQNIPVSGSSYPNWRRRFRQSFEQWRRDPALCATLNNINHARSVKVIS